MAAITAEHLVFVGVAGWTSGCDHHRDAGSTSDRLGYWYKHALRLASATATSPSEATIAANTTTSWDSLTSLLVPNSTNFSRTINVCHRTANNP